MKSEKRNREYARISVAERLWRHVEKTDGCWNWIGRSRYQFGYGVIRVPGDVINTSKAKAAHRVSWELVNGPIPPGMFVCHKCDNPSCVRPEHLFLGTVEDNNRDMRNKGRHNRTDRARGEAHWSTTITENDVREIRRRRAAGEIYRTIAADFKITIAATQRISTRASWSWLD